LDTTNLKAKITIKEYPARVTRGEPFSIDVSLGNLSKERWISLLPNPVHLSYHWIDETGRQIVFEGIRTLIRYPLFPDETRQFTVDIIAPEKCGDYVLQITLVQEGCFWFEQVDQNLGVNLIIKINNE
jgi:hypothetical protein